ncbi:MAG: polysaccharide deacetylase family protein [Aggregatilineales bacterium]
MRIAFQLSRIHAVLLLVVTVCGLALLTGNHSEVRAAPRPQGGVRVPVFMYHYISVPPAYSDHWRYGLSVVPDLFDQQMRWLQTHAYVTLNADQVADALKHNTSLPPRSLLLTFDDGYEDAYTNAFPTLKKYGLVGTFFVVTDWIDQGRSGYLTWTQVQEMARAGMSIEAHSRTHDILMLGSNTIDWLTGEIDGSIADIQTHIGVRPRLFAYPYGRYDKDTLHVMKASGIDAAFTTAYGPAGADRPLLTEPRIRVRGGETVAAFAAELFWNAG